MQKNTKVFFILTILILGVCSTSFAQNLNGIDSEELYEKGKSYIDETFPDCDISEFAPNCIFYSDADSEGNLTKDQWVNQFPHEYRLYIYYLKLENEYYLTDEEKQEKKSLEEAERREKESKITKENK